MKKVIVLIVLVFAMAPNIANAQITTPLYVPDCIGYGYIAASNEEDAWGPMTDAEFDAAWDFYTELCGEFGDDIDEPSFAE